MKKIIQSIKKLFESEKQSMLFTNKKKLLFIGIVVILCFNFFLYQLTFVYNFEHIQSRNKTTGFSHDKAQHFFYFYYYTGYFPLATLNKNLKYSKKDAFNEIENNGNNLIMEYGHWSRLGENLRIVTYYPNAIIRGSPKDPSIKLFNAILFVLGLISIFVAFVKYDRSLFSVVLVFVVNITPFFIYEIYGNMNILALLASVFLIITGLNLGFIYAKRIDYIKLLFLPITTGIIIGLSSEIRGETIILIVSAILIYLLSTSIKYYMKILVLLLVICSVYFTKKSITNYFDNNFQKTYELVVKHHGHPYTGKRIKGHRFWHPIFCGLGDFDNKYGYEWNDRVAYKYAMPILKNNYNLNLKYSGKLYLDEYYDKDSLYYKKLDDFDEYETVIKDKVLSDIKSDPLWYAEIILKRIINILSNTLPFPLAGWLFLGVLYFLFKTKKYNLIKILLISLPLSFTPLVIYSGDNTTFNSFFPIISTAIIITLIINNLLLKKQTKN